METSDELAKAARKNKTGTGQHAAVDDLTTAIMSGASPDEISRLEESSRGPGIGNNPGADDEGDYQEDSNAEQGQETGDAPSNAHRNAERIRLTGLEERDKGLVNAANIVARTEKIPFDEAWRRVKGEAGQQSDSQAEAGNGGDVQRGAPGAPSHEAIRQHHLQLAGELYNELKDANSAHWQEANRIATDPSHPDHDPEMLAKPHAALIVAKLAAANLGLRGGHARGSAAVHQPGGMAKPAAATKQSAPPPPRKSQAEMTRDSEQAALDAVEGNTPPPARRAQRGYLRL